MLLHCYFRHLITVYYGDLDVHSTVVVQDRVLARYTEREKVHILGEGSGIRQFWRFRDSGVQWDGPAVVFRPFRLLQEETKRLWGERTDVCTFRGIAAPGGGLF